MKQNKSIKPAAKIVLSDGDKKTRKDNLKTKRLKHSGKLFDSLNANAKDDLLKALLEERGWIDDAGKIV